MLCDVSSAVIHTPCRLASTVSTECVRQGWWGAQATKGRGLQGLNPPRHRSGVRANRRSPTCCPVRKIVVALLLCFPLPVKKPSCDLHKAAASAMKPYHLSEPVKSASAVSASDQMPKSQRPTSFGDQKVCRFRIKKLVQTFCCATAVPHAHATNRLSHSSSLPCCLKSQARTSLRVKFYRRRSSFIMLADTFYP